MFRKSINKQLFLFFSLAIILFCAILLVFNYFSFKNQIFEGIFKMKSNTQVGSPILTRDALQNNIVFYSERANEFDFISLYYKQNKTLIMLLLGSSLVLLFLLVFGVQNILQNAIKRVNKIIDNAPKNHLSDLDRANLPREFEPFISKIMKNEQQISGMSNQNQKFRAFASHELRNELAILLSLVEQSDNKDIETINHIYNLKETIDDLLLLSHFPDKLQFYKVDILLVIATVADTFAQQANIELHYDELATDFNITGTEVLLTRCIYNLINNAVLYSKDNSVIHVYIERIDSVLVVRIENEAINPSFNQKNGHGIGLELVNHIIYVLQGYFYKEINNDTVTTIISLQKNHQSLS